MILVTAANGHLGREVLTALLKKVDAGDIVAAAREPDKLTESVKESVRCRKADFDNPDSLVEACRDMNTLILIPSPAPKKQRIRQHRNVIRAAQDAGVTSIVFVSFMDAKEQSPLSYAAIFADTEKALAESKLTWTNMRMALYTDNMLDWLPQSLQTGELFASAGKGRVPYVTRADLAESIAVIATEEGHTGKTYELTGPEALSYHDVAALASEIYGKPIKYNDLSPEEHYQRIKGSGMLEHHIEGALGMSATTREGTFDHITDHVEKLTGHAPESVKSFLQRHPL